MRRVLLLVASVGLAVTVGATPVSAGGAGGQGGPIILMGLDADDSGHGDDSIFVGLLQSMLDDVNKSGSGIAVVGAGKGADQPTTWWTDVATGAGLTPTFVSGAANISSFDFSPFLLIGVASDEDNTSDAMTQEEHDAFAGRSGDVQSFVRSGGGVFGLTSDFDPLAGAQPYAYIAGAAPVTSQPGDFDFVEATPEGEAVGITDSNLDVNAWHNVFTSFPDFLKILAVHDEPGEPENFGLPAVIGGERVFGGECKGVKNLQGNHIVGSKKKDIIKGTGGRDIICGLGGNDVLRGLFGNDVILGGDGDDRILGGHGNDKLKGEDGNDELRGMVGNDSHNGGPGTDTCKGGRGKDSKKNCE